MTWILDDSKAIYLQLADEVKRRIITGVYPAGDHLPSVRDLAAEARVNPNTMQRALTQLESEGFLTTLRGSGRIVAIDTASIESERETLSRKELEEVVSRIRNLGVSNSDILRMVKDIVKEDTP